MRGGNSNLPPAAFRPSPAFVSSLGQQQLPMANLGLNHACLPAISKNMNMIIPSRMAANVGAIAMPQRPMLRVDPLKEEKARFNLPLHFTPGPYDVVCAKGNFAKNHPGNVRFRKFVDDYSEEYGHATSRVQKTILVNQIISLVRSVGGGFVKCDTKTNKGRWYDVGDAMAREKVGQSLRERNHSMYRSSTKAKRKKKREMNEKINDHVKTVMTTNDNVAAGLSQLADTVKHRDTSATASEAGAAKGAAKADGEDSNDEEEETESSSKDETDLELAMTKANSHILASLKNDESIKTILKESDEDEDEEKEE